MLFAKSLSSVPRFCNEDQLCDAGKGRLSGSTHVIGAPDMHFVMTLLKHVRIKDFDSIWNDDESLQKHCVHSCTRYAGQGPAGTNPNS